MNLTEIEAALKRLDEAAVRDGASQHYIEIRESGEEVIVGGNPEGLVRLALECVRLAQRGVPGTHVHIDEASYADVAERKLVIRVSEAPW